MGLNSSAVQDLRRFNPNTKHKGHFSDFMLIFRSLTIFCSFFFFFFYKYSFQINATAVVPAMMMIYLFPMWIVSRLEKLLKQSTLKPSIDTQMSGLFISSRRADFSFLRHGKYQYLTKLFKKVQYIRIGAPIACWCLHRRHRSFFSWLAC